MDDDTVATIVSAPLRTKFSVNQKKIKQIAECICQCLALPQAELTIGFVSSQKIRQLNRKFRAKDRATDVLSFPLMNWSRPRPLRKSSNVMKKLSKFKPPQHLGDVVISLAHARNNALSIGQSLDREVAFLMVHGILHLCGYDHLNPRDERRMLAAQRSIVAQLSAPSAVDVGLWKNCVRNLH